MTDKNKSKIYNCSNCETVSNLIKANNELRAKTDEICSKLAHEIKMTRTELVLFVIIFSLFLFVDYNGYYVYQAKYKIQNRCNETIFFLRHKYLNFEDFLEEF